MIKIGFLEEWGLILEFLKDNYLKMAALLKDKRALMPLHIIVGVMVIAGGLLYVFNQSGAGLVINTIGLLIEAIINWSGKLAG